jgi:site-specific recombinase XerD
MPMAAYLQLVNGVYRFYRKKPLELQDLLGKAPWCIPLKTASGQPVHDRREAERLVLPHIEETNEIIELARAGLPLGVSIERLALQFWIWAASHRRETNPPYCPEHLEEHDFDGYFGFGLPQFAADRPRLNAAVTRFLTERSRPIKLNPSEKTFGLLLNEVLGYADQSSPLHQSAPSAPPREEVAASAAAHGSNITDPYVGLIPDARKPFMDFLDQYLTDRKHIKGGKDDSTAKGYRKTFERLEALIGKQPIAAVSTLQVEEFYQSLRRTPSPKHQGKMLHHDTIYRSKSNIMAFYTWAVARHLAHDNPARKVIVEDDSDDDESRWEPFTRDELNEIIRALANEVGHKLWLPLVAMFSGMRLNEASELEVTDVFKLNGRDHFRLRLVSEFGNQKHLKSKSSRRQIPVHPYLIERGFFEYVEKRRAEAKDGRIFPRYDYSGWWNDKPSPKYPRRIGFLTRIGIKSATKNFHSFRHSFRDALKPATPDKEARDRIMGHFPEGTGAERYGSRDLLPHESEIIDRVVFHGIDLTPLRNRHEHERQVRGNRKHYAPARDQPPIVTPSE